MRRYSWLFLFVVIIFACARMARPVSAQYTTQGPQSCTGLPGCSFQKISSCSCGTWAGPATGSEGQNICTHPISGVQVYCPSTPQCGFDSSCISWLPAGCAGATDCYWVSADDCGGGSCGVGETRIGVQWCNTPLGTTVHCADSCSPDASCGAINPGTTNTPGGPADPPPAESATNTPVPVGTIVSRAVQVAAADTSCSAIRAVPTTDSEVAGTVHQFTPSSASQPTPQTQTLATYVPFTDLILGQYMLDTVPPDAKWAYVRTCWRNATLDATDGIQNNCLPAGSCGENPSVTLGNNDTVYFDVGYTLGTAWTQAEGGDVYSSGTLRSYIPSVTPRVFVTDGTGGYPGFLQYGTGYDFDSEPAADGNYMISSTNWEVEGARTTVDYYSLLHSRYGAPTVADSFADLSNVTEPPSREDPYYVIGNMTTTGDWTIGDGDNVVFLIDGNLTLGGKVNITGSGFAAFIVNGTISVASSVGSAIADTTPDIEGIYIASKEEADGSFSGIFATGTSAGASPRLVGRGMFVADSFLLQRDLEGYGSGNTLTPAELFVYNPRLLIEMPEELKDIATTWQEVDP